MKKNDDKAQNVIALIDGFNMYGALSAEVRTRHPFEKYKWINYWHLMEQFLQPTEKLKAVYYFTTYPERGMYDWKAKRARHVVLVDVQRGLGVKVVKGRFAARDRRCLVPTRDGGCGKVFTRHEEKRTDVNIAVKLVSLAYEKAYDVAFLVTADSDLVPAVEQAKRCYPKGRIIGIPPIGRMTDAFHLNRAVDDKIEMLEKHLVAAALPRQVTLRNGRTIDCPKEWR